MIFKKFFVFIFICSALLHTGYYISAYATNWFDPIFQYVYKEQDFFQIPSGAFSFIHGGTLDGHVPNNTDQYMTGGNHNVYHPLTTLIIGIPLQALPPWTAYGVWVGFHFIVTLFSLLCIRKNFHSHPYYYLGISLYLVNTYQYYDIKLAQYHFLLNTILLVMLIQIHKTKDGWIAGFFLFLSLLIKPIALLFIIPLVFYRYWKTAIIGTGLFAIVTLPTVFFPQSSYYVKNVIGSAQTLWPNYNILALHYLLGIPISWFIFPEILSAFLLFLWQCIKKPSIIVVLFAWICFQIIFYNGVYPYYYSIFSVFIPLLIFSKNFPLNTITVMLITAIFTQPITTIARILGEPGILSIPVYSASAVLSSISVIVLLIYIMANQSS